jgi:hypothetical protein
MWLSDANGLYQCYEMYARISGAGLTMNGRSVFYKSPARVQAATGSAVVDGETIVWGIEGCPNPGPTIAVKAGGHLSLSTLTGTGWGYHLSQPIFQYTFQTRLVPGPCPPQFVPAADQ